MITEQDVNFHHPADADYLWAETNYFSFYLPEHNLVGFVYTVMRPGVGACNGEVVIFNKLSLDRRDVVYYDANQHMPLPADLGNYTLPNGISIEATGAPRDYQVDYVGTDDTELHLEVKGLMDPYDIHDPAMCPTAPAARADQVEGSGFGAAYGGHFDMTSRVTGTLKLFGETFDIDCVDTMDHSWGPRSMRDLHTLAWGHAHFGEDYTCHAIWQFDPFAETGPQFKVAHGYTIEDGGVHGLTGGVMQVLRHQGVMTSAVMQVTDRRGREHRITGRTLSADNWICYTAMQVNHVFLEWDAEGRTGHGAIQETFPLAIMARANSAATLARMAATTEALANAG